MLAEDLGSLSEHEGRHRRYNRRVVLTRGEKNHTFCQFFLRQNKFIFTSGGVLSDPGDGTELMFCLLKPPDTSVLGLYTSHPSLPASAEVQGAPCSDVPPQRTLSSSAEASATFTQ